MFGQIIGDDPLVDVLLFLKRLSFEGFARSNRRFHAFVVKFSPYLPLRAVECANITGATDGRFRGSIEPVEEGDPGERDALLSYNASNVEEVVSLVMTALRLCFIASEFRIERFRLSDRFVDAMVQYGGAVTVKGTLKFCGTELEDLSNGGLLRLMGCFSSIGRLSLGRSSDLLAQHVNDALLRSCMHADICKVELPNFRPMTSEFYHISEEAIYAFIFQSSPQTRSLQLTLAHVEINPTFCRRLVAANVERDVLNKVELTVKGVKLHEQEMEEFDDRRKKGRNDLVTYEFKDCCVPFRLMFWTRTAQLVLQRG